MTQPTLTVAMPFLNEEATIRGAVDRLLGTELPVPVEVLLVDDGSTDGSVDAVKDLVEAGRIRLVQHARNRGKGAALQTAIAEARGELFTILDCDMEYDPADYAEMLVPVLDGRAQVVYGTRSFGGHAAFSFWYVLGNKAIAFWTSFLYNAWLSDVETCLKLAPTALWRSLGLSQPGFGIEAEATARFLKAGERIFEVPVTYAARGRAEGKKLHWQDGVEALWILLRERFRR